MSCLVLSCLVLGVASDARALDLLGVRAGNILVTFDSDAPATTRTLGAVTGLQAGEQLVAIDIHPDTGQLYGITDAARLYRIHPQTRAATVLGTPLLITTASGVGLSFNPASWQLIVVTGAGEQVSLDAATGDVLAATAVPETGITAIAHQFGTSFYGLNTTGDTLVLFGAGPTPSTLGALGFDTEATASFDIAANGSVAYAVLDAPAAAASTLARVDLATGAATVVGEIGGGKIVAATVWTRNRVILALTSDNRIVSFSSTDPGTILTNTPVQGLQPGEPLAAIDSFLGSSLYAVATGGRFYVLNGGMAAPVNINYSPSPNPNGNAELDFTVPRGRPRFINDAGYHVTYAPDTSLITPHTPLTGAAIVGLASRYRSGAGTPTPTTLFGIDAATDRLVRIGDADGDPESANAGVITPIGPLGIDVTGDSGMDIVNEDGTAFAVFTNPGATSSTLYVVSLATGRVTPVGTIGGGVAISDIAVPEYDDPTVPKSVSFASATASAAEGSEVATITIQRTGPLAGPIWVEYWGFAITAESATDFIQELRRVTIPDGHDHIDVDVLIINDGDDEGDETFDINLVGASPGVNTGDGIHSTRVTIVDDDPPALPENPRVNITSQFQLPVFPEQRSFTDIEGIAETGSPARTIASLTWKSNHGYSGTLPNSSPWLISNVPLRAGYNVITVRVETSDGLVATDVVNITVTSLIYSLAEGATGTFFRTSVAIVNPGDEPAPMNITLLRENGTKVIFPSVVAQPNSRMTIPLNDISELGQTAVSTVVTSTEGKPLIVERTMQWGDGDYGAHTEKAIVDTSFNWYFAEGSQGFFDTYVLLTNPHTVQMTATVSFLREGEPPFNVGLTLEPTSRKTIAAGDYPELVGRSFGIWVMFGSSGGSAERAMYFGRPPEPLWKAGHESAGVAQLSKTWFLAEGATGPFFETFLLLANPNGAPASATLTFLPDEGAPVTREVGIPANGRTTVNLEALDPPAPELANAAVATQVVSDQPIVVERAQYWPGPPNEWYEAHNSFGVVATHTRWGLAEGRVGNPPGEDGKDYQTYILLANPTANQVEANVRFLRRSGAAFTKTVAIGPNSRVNLRIAGPDSDVPELADEHFGAVITSNHPIAVERAMYSNANGQVFAAGTNATASPLP